MDINFLKLSTFVEQEMARMKVPGTALGVMLGEKDWQAGFGITSIENPLPVTPDTLFQVGSITKTVVATAIIRLVEENKLDLDAPLQAYMPNLRLKDPLVTTKVTLRHILTHTAGWVGDYFNDFGPGPDALRIMVERISELPQLTPVGEIYSYNNAGFYLAGRLIEEVTGKNFERTIQDLVLHPLEMSKSFFFAEDVISYRFVAGHELRDGQVLVCRPWSIGRASFPAGGLISCVPDLLKYARFQMGDGRVRTGQQMISSENMAKLHTPYLASTGINFIGLSWMMTTIDSVKVIFHGGATNGQETHLMLVPSRQFAICTLSNSNEGGGLCYETYKFALEAFLGIKWPIPERISMTDSQLSPFLGIYDSAMAQCELTTGEGGLVLQVRPKGHFPTPESPPVPQPPPVRMAFYDQDKVICLDHPFKEARGEFLRDSQGNLIWMRMSGRLHKRLGG